MRASNGVGAGVGSAYECPMPAPERGSKADSVYSVVAAGMPASALRAVLGGSMIGWHQDQELLRHQFVPFLTWPFACLYIWP